MAASASSLATADAVDAVRADGRVLARCWRSCTATVSAREAQSERTGRSAETRQLCTPWLNYPAQEESPAFLASEIERFVTPVVGSYFPIWLQRTVRYEVSQEYAPRSLDVVRAEAAEAALRKLSLAVGDDQIVDKWVDYCMIVDETLTATATAETIVDIAAYSPS